MNQTTDVIEFTKFAKIPRLFRDCEVTEKIDGTNAQIVIPEDPTKGLSIGSRNRWIVPGKGTDNFGFAAWVTENETALRRLGPGRHYGEWWGAGIGRRYGLATRRWSLFSQKPLPEGLPPEVANVPLLYAGVFDTKHIDKCNGDLLLYGSVACPGWMEPEGIVVFHKASGQRFKFTLDGDAKFAPSPEENA